MVYWGLPDVFYFLMKGGDCYETVKAIYTALFPDLCHWTSGRVRGRRRVGGSRGQPGRRVCLGSNGLGSGDLGMKLNF